MLAADAQGNRFVVLGLATARSAWFGEVGRWSTSAVIPVDFVRCVSAEELRARLTSGRAFSTVLIDGGVSGADRDLIELANAHGVSTIVVASPVSARDWTALGAAAVLEPTFDREQLVDHLESHARRLGRVDGPANLHVASPVARESPAAKLVAVTGANGAGSSTVAIGVAQSLSDDPRFRELTLLADLALHGDQAMLHDARDIVPGLQELVDSHRGGIPSPSEVRSMVFQPQDRSYHLILGLRRHRDWAALRPRALQSALDSLAQIYRIIVADVDPDVEGETETGSVEVEERNLLARSTLQRADLVLAVGTTGMKGLNDFVRLTHDLIGLGIDGKRIMPVVNRSPRAAKSRAEITAAIGSLLAPISSDIPSVVHSADRKRIEEALRDGLRLPEGFAKPLGDAVQGAIESRIELAAPTPTTDPVTITPGSLGQLSPELFGEGGAA